MAHLAAVVTVAYGGLVLLGGLMGWLKAKSKPSLIMGGLFGIALLAVGIAGMRGWAAAPRVAALIAAFLLAFFGIRFARKKKFMPAGMLAGVSLLALVVEVLAIVSESP